MKKGKQGIRHGKDKHDTVYQHDFKHKHMLSAKFTLFEALEY